MNAFNPLGNAVDVNILDVAVFGAGFSGIGAAIKLKEANFTNFVVFEKAAEIGGVWRENTYPGCACDVPSALYSYSYAPNPEWSRMFARQEEIKQYIKQTAKTFNVMQYVRLNHEMQETHWDDDQKHWEIKTSQGVYYARFIIMACGPMHEPVYPKIKGLTSFKGEIFHSARWNHDYDLTDKRVAVIGSGASAIQFVPEIQPKVAKLTLLQRTPQWVMPKVDQHVPSVLQKLFDQWPVTQQLVRGGVYGVYESLNNGSHHPDLIKPLENVARWNIRRAIKDPILRDKLIPDFTIGCKRILQSSDWYPALAQSNVEVLRTGVTEIKGNTVTASNGSQHEVDAIILGTGFEVSNPPIAKKIRGKSGKTLAEVWDGSPTGYLGTMTTECPNAFVMIGPNSAITNSAFIIIEAQVSMIVEALTKARQNNILTIEVNPERQTQFNDEVQQALQNTVWNVGGCSSYFIDANGRNSTVWPWSTFEMRRRMAKFDLKDYVINQGIHA